MLLPFGNRARGRASAPVRLRGVCCPLFSRPRETSPRPRCSFWGQVSTPQVTTGTWARPTRSSQAWLGRRFGALNLEGCAVNRNVVLGALLGLALAWLPAAPACGAEPAGRYAIVVRKEVAEGPWGRVVQALQERHHGKPFLYQTALDAVRQQVGA